MYFLGTALATSALAFIAVIVLDFIVRSWNSFWSSLLTAHTKRSARAIVTQHSDDNENSVRDLNRLLVRQNRVARFIEAPMLGHRYRVFYERSLAAAAVSIMASIAMMVVASVISMLSP